MKLNMKKFMGRALLATSPLIIFGLMGAHTIWESFTIGLAIVLVVGIGLVNKN